MVVAGAPPALPAGPDTDARPADQGTPRDQLEEQARRLLEEVRRLDASRARTDQALAEAEAERSRAALEVEKAQARRLDTEAAYQRSRSALAAKARAAWLVRGRDALTGILAQPDRARAARTWRHLKALARHDTQAVHGHAARVAEHAAIVASLDRTRADLEGREARIASLRAEVVREEQAKRSLLFEVLAERERGIRIEELAARSLADLTGSRDGAAAKGPDRDGNEGEGDRGTRAGSASDAAGRKARSRTPFARARGALAPPVEGRLVVPFGAVRDPTYRTVTRSRGVSLRAPRGSEVRAVHDGKVTFRGYVAGYGNLVILDHGDEYLTVYGHLRDVRPTPGDEVRRGDVVAAVGSSGVAGFPELYFEIRHRGEALDPMTWLRPGSGKAPGSIQLRGHS
jgi:septal ring factor EnvC (AmiA/AmiB activator)